MDEKQNGKEFRGNTSELTAPKTLEQVTKVAALVGATCYAAGLVVTNAYLQSIGVADFSPLKVRFLYSGATALACIGTLVLAAILGVRLTLTGTRDIWLDHSSRRGLFNLLLGISVCAEILVLNLVIRRALRHERFTPGTLLQSINLEDIVWAGAWAGALVVLLVCGRYLIVLADRWRRTRSSLEVTLVGVKQWQLSVDAEALSGRWLRDSRFGTFILALLFGIYVVGTLCGLLVMYGVSVFPLLPEQFGGAMPRRVNVAFKGESEAKLKKMGVCISPSSGLAESVDLLYDSDERIVVRVWKPDADEAEQAAGEGPKAVCESGTEKQERPKSKGGFHSVSIQKKDVTAIEVTPSALRFRFSPEPDRSSR